MTTILLVQFAADRSGSALSGLLVAEAMIDSGHRVVVAFSHEGSMTADYRSLGCQVVVAPHRNWLRQASRFGLYRNVCREYLNSSAFLELIDSIQPVLIYINTLASMAAAVPTRKRGIPLIWHLRELFADVGGEMHAPPLLRKRIGKFLTSGRTLLIANSRYVADNILGEARSDAATIIYNAVDDSFRTNTLDAITARSILGLASECRYIGIPGTLRPVKGHQFFLESTASWLQTKPDVRVLITGSTNSAHGKAIIELTLRLGLEQQVVFLGEITDMPAFYRACNIVCVPSKAEPFGRVVIEAFASGTPVVATGVGGITEVISNGQNGLHTDFGNGDALVTSITGVLENCELADSLTHRARTDFESLYSLDAHKRAIQSCLARAMVLPC